MSAYTIAALSMGLIYVGSGGSPPSAYDVRYGVDNGAGDIGTLTSPLPGNVRQGVTYGGDGTQYTGTLAVPTFDATAWRAARRIAFSAELVMFGTNLTCNAVTVPALCTGKEYLLEMKRNAMLPTRPCVFSILREDYVAIGSPTSRDTVSSLGFTFQILAPNDDDADATIDLRCTLDV